MTTTAELNAEAATRALDRQILALAAVVVLGTIMTVLDLTIVNVAIPTLGRDFATSIARSSCSARSSSWGRS